MDLPTINRKIDCGFALSNYKNEKVLISGGEVDNVYPINGTSIFDLNNLEWSIGPDMISARTDHNSCVFGNSVFVFCGRNSIEALDTVEMLKMEPMQSWVAVELKGEIFSCRT